MQPLKSHFSLASFNQLIMRLLSGKVQLIHGLYSFLYSGRVLLQEIFRQPWLQPKAESLQCLKGQLLLQILPIAPNGIGSNPTPLNVGFKCLHGIQSLHLLEVKQMSQWRQIPRSTFEITINLATSAARRLPR